MAGSPATIDGKTCRRPSLQSLTSRKSGTTHGDRLSTYGDRLSTHGDRLSTHCDELTVAQGSSWDTLRVRPSRRYSKTAVHVELGRAFSDLTLGHVLEDKKLLSRFAAFLENEHSIENLRFHESASAFLEANGATHAGGLAQGASARPSSSTISSSRVPQTRSICPLRCERRWWPPCAALTPRSS